MYRSTSLSYLGVYRVRPHVLLHTLLLLSVLFLMLFFKIFTNLVPMPG